MFEVGTHITLCTWWMFWRFHGPLEHQREVGAGMEMWESLDEIPTRGCRQKSQEPSPGTLQDLVAEQHLRESGGALEEYGAAGG